MLMQTNPKQILDSHVVLCVSSDSCSFNIIIGLTVKIQCYKVTNSMTKTSYFNRHYFGDSEKKCRQSTLDTVRCMLQQN